MSGTYKIIRDPIHNYINVPINLCKLFIDTPIFQRLRNIEQTTMRPLYPSARHDRFAHSLGVYYLAEMAFKRLVKNTERDILARIEIDKYYYPFIVAALMHDCGHAPFSHLFEEYYNREQKSTTFLFDLVGKSFRSDYKVNFEDGPPPSAHEIFSAAILLKYYRESLLQVVTEDQFDIIARMITGNIHSLTTDRPEREIENCLIRLINGPAIDVDKLDYIIRDTWASGVNNVTIDVHRLLSALEIVNYGGKLLTAFRKSALSVIQSVVDGRNFLHKYIYSHHIVKYYSEVLKTAFKECNKRLGGDELINTIFSEDVFKKPVSIKNHSFYLPTDGDLLYVMKEYYNEINEVKEFFSRAPSFIPLWKTRAEFEIIFEKRPRADQRSNIKRYASTLLNSVIGDQTEVKTFSINPNVNRIEDGDIYIYFNNGEIIQYNDSKIRKATISGADEEIKSPYFIIYVHKNHKDSIGDCIKLLEEASV